MFSPTGKAELESVLAIGVLKRAKQRLIFVCWTVELHHPLCATRLPAHIGANGNEVDLPYGIQKLIEVEHGRGISVLSFHELGWTSRNEPLLAYLIAALLGVYDDYDEALATSSLEQIAGYVYATSN